MTCPRHRAVMAGIRCFAADHPDAFTPRGRELSGSLAKRILGEIQALNRPGLRVDATGLPAWRCRLGVWFVIVVWLALGARMERDAP